MLVRCCCFAAALSLALPGDPALAQAPAASAAFDPLAAFCERQTFTLEETVEVLPWLDYVGGLRVARTEAPEINECASSTIRAIYNIATSTGAEGVDDLREGFLGFYVGRAMQPELAERKLDQDGTFRYLNDVTLASFAWLTCPGSDRGQLDCVRGIVEELPPQFLRTSPVFCDFAAPAEGDRVEWPPETSGLPLLCSETARSGSPEPDAWLAELDRAIPR